MKQQSEEERQREMKRLNQKWKSKEENLQMDHKNEMNRVSVDYIIFKYFFDVALKVTDAAVADDDVAIFVVDVSS